MILGVKITPCRSVTPSVLESILLLPDCLIHISCSLPSMYFRTLWNFKILLPHYHSLLGILKDREEYFYVTTSRISNHRLFTYLWVAFNTDRVTCHQMEAARILAFSVAVCQSWFLRVCLTHFVNCWTMFDKCSIRKIYATELSSGLVCYFSNSVLQDGEVFLSSPCLSLSWGLGGETTSRVEQLLTSYPMTSSSESPVPSICPIISC